jgi:hypothetical protein
VAQPAVAVARSVTPVSATVPAPPPPEKVGRVPHPDEKSLPALEAFLSRIVAYRQRFGRMA